MPIFDADSIRTVALHRVGNSATDEGFVLSLQPLQLDDQMQDLLVQYFINPFKVEEYYHLCGDGDDRDTNEVYRRCRNIFDSQGEELFEESKAIAEYLYRQSTHPNIKGGDFFVVYFSKCQLNGETMDAIGLFKSENKDTFLKVLYDDADYLLEPHLGINIHKLDKGALIFHSEEEKGYVVSVVDGTNRTEATYWRDNFLHIEQRRDEYFHTHEVMNAYKHFVTEALPEEYEVTRADQADMLNKSVEYFKQNDSFDMDDFARDVLQQPEVIDSFAQYRQKWEQDNDVQLEEQFDINESAVKKQARNFKSVIKLDKNFHIYVHGDRQLIEQGEDEKGKFYKVYYKEES